MSDLNKLRNDIDTIDKELIHLFLKRMEVISKIKDYKKENDIKTLDKNREKEILERIEKEYKNNELLEYIKKFELNNIELSKELQNK